MIVLMPNCAFLSETSRMIAVHDALQARHVPVAVATHGGSYLDLLRREVADVHLLEPDQPAERCVDLVAGVPGIGPRRDSMWTDDEIRNGALAEADYLRRVGASAVVTGFTLTTLLSSRLAGIPQVTSHAGSFVPPVLERRMLPADPPGLPAAVRLLPGPLRRRMVNAGPLMIKDYCQGFNRVARELGVEPVPSLMALLCGDLTLVTEAAEVLGIDDSALQAWRPGRGLRSSTRMRLAGPLYARLDMPVPDRVQDFLAKPGPVAYVALTSTSARMVADVIAAARAARLRVLAVSTVHEIGGSDDSDVLIERVLPSHQVMPHVDVAVIAGGQGSVQTALASGTPFVGIPLQPEQNWNVHLARQRGAARRVLPDDINRSMAAVIASLVRDDGARGAAIHVRDIYSRIDGASAAANAIIEFTGVQRSVSP